MLMQLVVRMRLAPTLAASSVLAGFSLILLHRAGAILSIGRLLWFFVGTVVVVLSGRLVVEYAMPRPCIGRLVTAIVTGYAVTTAVLLTCYFVFGLNIVVSFIIWSLVVAIGFAYLSRGKRASPHRLGGLDLAFLSATAAIVCYFCRDVAPAVSSIEETGVLPLWLDYFIHGAEIAQFGTPGPWVKGDILLAGVSLPLYHYGIFMLPALVQTLFDLPGLTAASAFLLPLGLLLAYASGVTLAVRLGGLRAGILALALFLVPSGALYGVGHWMLDFHWLSFASPGTGYSLAIAAAALVLVERVSISNRSAAIVAALLVLILFQVRVQIFLLLAPALLIMAMLRIRAVRMRWRRVALAAGIIALGVLVALAWSPALRDLVGSLSGASSFLGLMARDIDGRLGYGDLYRLVAAWPRPLANIGRAALLLPLIFGPLLVMFLAIPWLGKGGTRPALKQMDLLFWLLLAGQFGLFAFAPAGQNGDDSEYAHRPFPLVYMVATILLAAHAARAPLLRALAPRLRTASAAFATAATAIALSAVLLAVATGFDPALGRMSGALTTYSRPTIDRGVVALAAELNRRAAPGDTIAVGPLDPASRLIDNGVIIASLANRAVYLAQPGLQLLVGGERGAEARRRLQTLGEAEKALADGRHEIESFADRFAFYVDTRDASSVDGGPIFANSFGRIYGIRP
jgi:hypothetical protein